MFLDDNKIEKHKQGWIEVICGGMFSGKTEELIRRLNRAVISKQRVEIFKPDVDTRYSEHNVVSHNETAISSTPVNSSSNIILLASEADVVGIDEAQFFDNNIVDVCNILAAQGKRVIVAGLDMDFSGKPFGPIPLLLATAEYVTKVHAVCMRCGNLALYSYRKNNSKKLVLLGEKDEYEPLCRQCYTYAVNKQIEEL